MLFIPLPFVVTLLLLILFATLARRDREDRPDIPFMALILLVAGQSFLAGLRWGYGVQAVGWVTPVLAGLVPPLVWCGVLAVLRRDWFHPSRILLHALPALSVAGLMALDRDLIDPALVVIFLGYAGAILRMMRRGADTLRLTPLERAGTAYRAILFAASALLLTAVMDLAVYLDFALLLGRNALPIIQTGNLAALALLAIAAAAIGRTPGVDEPRPVAAPPASSQPPSLPPSLPPPSPPHSPPTDDDGHAAALRAIDGLLTDRHIYRDVDLTLDRLARRLGMPARQISGAINQLRGKNVSQYINEFRVAEACDLLARSDRPVTEIMFDVGFQTKSNFNREFRRVTGMTPVQWRQVKSVPG
ncbi:MAG: helix-turn-helix domain-containing protein [Paracoccus sp. (in: a-proteobacteria)]|uniref:helix-turn-helix domain-containing protein n=1 Tax=Paracoccus sp. TaxID=267 RepID=UPI00391A58B1